MAAATFYLVLPYTGMYVGQAHHVWPMALVVWALAAYRLPMLAGFLLGLAASTAYFTAFLFPIWLGFYWKRGTGRFLAAFFLTAMVCLGTIGAILWVQGELAEKIREALTLPDWQPWKVPTTEGCAAAILWSAAAASDSGPTAIGSHRRAQRRVSARPGRRVHQVACTARGGRYNSQHGPPRGDGEGGDGEGGEREEGR